MKLEWIKISEEKGGCYPHPLSIGMHACGRGGKLIYELIGKPEKGFYMDSLTTFSEGKVAYYFYEHQFDKAARELFEAIKKDPDVAKTIKQKHLYHGKYLMRLGEQIKTRNLAKTGNKELAKMFQKQANSISNLWAWGLTISILEYKTPYLSQHLEQQVKLMTKDYHSYLQLLLTPDKETYFRKEKLHLLEIAKEIKADDDINHLFLKKRYNLIPHNHPIINKVTEHNKAFNWINYYYSGPKLKLTDHFTTIAEHLGRNIEAEITKIKTEFIEIRKQQKALQRNLKLEPNLINLLNITRDFSYLKAFRKDALYHSFHAMDLILEEIAARFQLPMLSLRQLLPQEIVELLLGGKIIDNEIILARHKSCAYLVRNNTAKLIFDDDLLSETSHVITEQIQDVAELKGQVASLGKARAKVKVINNISDLKKMEDGDILVSIATNPTLVPAMRKAAAIVTDIGGITCHAAIISRELGVPCVIGTKHATKLLKDGDMVEVDAEHGVVKIIK